MAKAVRLKAPAQPVPQSQEEADQLLGEIGALQREVDRAGADLTDQVARLKAGAAEQVKPLDDAIKAKFAALLSWAEANRSTLLQGRRRSLTMAQGVIGWRMGNPTVRVTKGQEDAVIATLGRLGLDRFLRVIREIDREAILRDVGAIDGVAGIAVEQTEAFFAKPLDVEVERTATVKKLTGAAAVETADASA